MNSNQQTPLDIHYYFFCRKTHKYPNGDNPVVLRVIYRGQRKDVFTGIGIPIKFWTKSKQQVKAQYAPAPEINSLLQKIIRQVDDSFQKLKYLGEQFGIDDLVDAMKGKEPPPQTLQEYINLREIELADQVGIEIAKSTFYKYRRAGRYLIEFLMLKTRSRNIPVSKINLDFIKAFYQFIRKEKNNGHNAATSLIGCFRSILLPAITNRVIRENPFDKFEMKRDEVIREFLEMNEIKLLEDLEGLSPLMDIKRDAFLIACYTGLAYSDLKELRGYQIQEDNDGTLYIKRGREKNGGLSIIPLLPKAEAILKKYSPTNDCRNFEWKIPSNQKFNLGLKELAEMTGIEKPLFVHLGRHTFATTVTLSNGVSLESVSKMLGHTTIKHTQIYAKVVAAKVKNEMKAVRDLF